MPKQRRPTTEQPTDQLTDLDSTAEIGFGSSVEVNSNASDDPAGVEADLDDDVDSEYVDGIDTGKLDPAFIDEDGRPIKGALKRRANELQGLGEALIALPQADLDAIAMPERLRDAVMLARRITAHGGLYRQKQFIGKLMRKLDAEPIRAAIQARQEAARYTARQFHRVERWRNRLIDEPACLDEFASLYPKSERPHLTRLIEQARHERDRRDGPGAARELFGYVKHIVDDHHSTPPSPAQQ
jgi:ribosome-associated protein